MYIVVLNATIQNFIIFVFVINLTKMKGNVFKKFEEKSYTNQMNYDAKDRLQKIIYIVLFLLTVPERQI